MGLVFKNLITGEIVSFNGGLAFAKLSVSVSPELPPVFPNNFDLRLLGLKPGVYILTVTATAEGAEESSHRNEIIYTVE